MIDLAEETAIRILEEIIAHAEHCTFCCQFLLDEFGIEVEWPE